MTRAAAASWAAFVIIAASCFVCAAVAEATDTVEGRVGRTFWARPGLSDTSEEFYEDPELRHRIGIHEKIRFAVVDVRAGGGFPVRDPVYEVKLADGRQAFIDTGDFERRLYRELRPNEVSVSPRFEPPLGQGVQVHQFERASIFAADPDVMWARIRNQGPRAFRPGTHPAQPGAEVPPAITPADPVAPTIRPR